MTFSFEMRSGREHNTPDKAMWGFSCTVRAQVSLLMPWQVLVMYFINYQYSFIYSVTSPSVRCA